MKANRKARRVARTLYRLCLVNGVVDDARARRVGRRLASSGSRGSLPILSEFHRFLHLDHDRHTGLVESATPLEAPLRDEKLSKQKKAEIKEYRNSNTKKFNLLLKV